MDNRGPTRIRFPRAAVAAFIATILFVPWEVSYHDGGDAVRRVSYAPAFIPPSFVVRIMNIQKTDIIPDFREPQTEHPALPLLAFEWAAILGLSVVFGWRPFGDTAA